MTYDEPSFLNYLWSARPDWIRLDAKTLLITLVSIVLIGLFIGVALSAGDTDSVRTVIEKTATLDTYALDELRNYNSLLDSLRRH